MSKRDDAFWKANALMEKERAEANQREVYPCPFCKAVHSEDGDSGPQVGGTHPGTDWVECEDCGASGPHQNGKRRAKGAAERARVAWNAWVHSAVEASMAILKGHACHGTGRKSH
jgi:hypothetical protein